MTEQAAETALLDGCRRAGTLSSGFWAPAAAEEVEQSRVLGARRVATCRRERPAGLLVDFRQATRLQLRPRLDGVLLVRRVRPIRRVHLCQLLCSVLLVFSCFLLQSFWSLMTCCLPIWQPATNTDRPNAGQSACFFLLSLKALSIITD